MLRKISTTLTHTNIKILFEGKYIELNKPVCQDINRLYLPLIELLSHINGTLKLSKQNIAIMLPERTTVYLNKLSTILHYNDLYISLIDLCTLFDIKTVWNCEIQSVFLYFNRENINATRANNSQRPALIRFEDITAGNIYLEDVNLEYLRVIGDFLYSAGIPFHIAWIPRYMDPPSNIDNDISENYNMPNSHFLFTIDYLLSKGGIIGLHGYTHQYDDEVSGEGTEFNEERNNDEESIRNRTEAAIALSDKLNLPYKFFESPHYASTEYQQSIFEEYFDIMYECYVGIWGDKVVVSPRNQRTRYIPTPLDYVQGEDGVDEMLKRIENLNEDSLDSLFFHPFLEFNYITIKTMENGYHYYVYKTNSPLHQITNALFEKNCRFIKVTNLY